MVLVKREALIHLGAGDVWEAARDDAVHRLSVLEQADDVVDADARALDDGMAAAHAGLARDVALSDRRIVSTHKFKITSDRFLQPGFVVEPSGG